METISLEFTNCERSRKEMMIIINDDVNFAFYRLIPRVFPN